LVAADTYTVNKYCPVLPYSIELRIDDEDVGGQITSSSFSSNPDSVFLGKDTFKGCISNLYLRR
jgi:hypothetical protein